MSDILPFLDGYSPSDLGAPSAFADLLVSGEDDNIDMFLNDLIPQPSKKRRFTEAQPGPSVPWILPIDLRKQILEMRSNYQPAVQRLILKFPLAQETLAFFRPGPMSDTGHQMCVKNPRRAQNLRIRDQHEARLMAKVGQVSAGLALLVDKLEASSDAGALSAILLEMTSQIFGYLSVRRETKFQS